MKTAAAEWKQMSDTSKSNYVTEYEREKAEYDRKFKQYVDSGKLDAWKRDPEKPKKPPTAFFLLAQEVRTSNPTLKITEQTKIAGQKWKGMSAQERQKYESMAAPAIKEYKDNMEKYRASGKEAAWLAKTGRDKADKAKEKLKEKALLAKQKVLEKKAKAKERALLLKKKMLEKKEQAREKLKLAKEKLAKAKDQAEKAKLAKEKAQLAKAKAKAKAKSIVAKATVRAPKAKAKAVTAKAKATAVAANQGHGEDGRGVMDKPFSRSCGQGSEI